MGALKNPRREAFCREYLKDSIAVRAAKRAGYSERTAATGAWRLVHRPEIRARILELTAAQMKRLQMEADAVLVGLARVAQFDPRKLFDEAGRLIPVQHLDADTALSVASVEIEERTVKGGEDGASATVRTRKIRANDRVRALVALARHHNLFADDAKAGGEGLAGALLAAHEAGRRRLAERPPLEALGVQQGK
jgi:phage terminase small subunit